MTMLAFMAALWALTATAALAQEEYVEALSGWVVVQMVIKSLLHSAFYVLIYGFALGVTLVWARRFDSIDGWFIGLTLALWGGGMAINAVAYKLVSPERALLAALIALPLISGWTWFIGTRLWADLERPVALRLAVATALLCAPYFGPTWHTTPVRRLNEDGRRPAVVAAERLPRSPWAAVGVSAGTAPGISRENAGRNLHAEPRSCHMPISHN